MILERADHPSLSSAQSGRAPGLPARQGHSWSSRMCKAVSSTAAHDASVGTAHPGARALWRDSRLVSPVQGAAAPASRGAAAIAASSRGSPEGFAQWQRPNRGIHRRRAVWTVPDRRPSPFVLQPEFALSAAVLASEALRSANQNRGRELFRWCSCRRPVIRCARATDCGCRSTATSTRCRQRTSSCCSRAISRRSATPRGF